MSVLSANQQKFNNICNDVYTSDISNNKQKKQLQRSVAK